jgi:hypothetical protein
VSAHIAGLPVDELVLAAFPAAVAMIAVLRAKLGR